MESLSVNQSVIRNGNWGEQCALPILQEKFGNVDYVNGLIDFYDENGIPIEVKTCQEFIRRCDDDGATDNRLGRFTLERDQHELLLTQDGYYLFLVRNGDMLVCAKVMKASDVFAWMSNFKRQVTWRFLFD